ncbi:MAG TPA: leucyl/phenylalanyl-tRNA--protein transferase [Verrucomicrobiota bacterium]|nr:leucyl/phenylalanyl-tRNA--protein transferase [Verrucomicrobiales bacterium]HRI13895.1 leucyl/phenylalanyl-tRNA--protein transferase [Verrucomicrobiota bacterium]
MVWLLDDRLWFPDPRQARNDGLLAVGGDLSPPRLLLGYRSGVFPWTAGPVTWWSPDPRAIFDLDRIHISRSLARTRRRAGFEITFDRDFPGVITGCAAALREGNPTWITREFIDAYCELHRAGHAHSVEVWFEGELAGGLYGVALGGFFAGESMFHRRTDASKVAVVEIARRLRSDGFALFDTQMVTPVTRQLGAFEVPRNEYLRRLECAVAQPEAWGRSEH